MQSAIKKGLGALLAGSAVAMAAGAVAGKPSDCWMTGGGSVFDQIEATYTGRTTHGFELHCDARNPNNLEINWAGNRFHLTDLNSAVCSDTALIQNPPDAEFDTFVGVGEGKLNGIPGAIIVFTFTDAGEPGVADTADIQITYPDSTTVALDVQGPLYNGNHQAHSN